jgi:hypothetical protein
MIMRFARDKLRRLRKMLGCRKVKREIDASIPAPSLDAQTRRHLEDCADCHSFYLERRRLYDLLKELPPIYAPDDFGERLRARLACDSNASGTLLPIHSAAAIMFTICALALGLALLRQKETNSPARKDGATVATLQIGALPTSSGYPIAQARRQPRTSPEQRRRRARSKVVATDFAAYPASSLILTDAPIESPANSALLFDEMGGVRTVVIKPLSFGEEAMAQPASANARMATSFTPQH